MASDLKVDIDNVRLNIRVGAIMKFKGKVLIEISNAGRNSVIPGGRIQINESSSSALVREAFEEMHFKMKEENLKQLTVFENFFNYDSKPFHEIYFLYQYDLNQEEYMALNNIKNFDNETTYFKFINTNELEKYDLLPLKIYPYILKD